MEIYLEVQWGHHIVFRDSFAFLSNSLEELTVSLVKTGVNKFTHTKAIIDKVFPGTPL